MRIPSVDEAEMIINEAYSLNPGDWVAHNKVAGN
jgi:hypothetical protein